MFGIFREQKPNVETKKRAMPKSIQPKEKSHQQQQNSVGPIVKWFVVLFFAPTHPVHNEQGKS
jgi:hypothetical protein